MSLKNLGMVFLAVFAPFAVLYMKQSLRLDHLWAALCLVGAVYFAFRGQQLKEGVLGHLYGFDLYMSQLVPVVGSAASQAS